MNVTIYHNPRCSKSRRALQLLRDQGVEPTIVEYLKTPLPTDEITRILALLDVEAREIIRTTESVYRENGLDDPGISDAQLIAAIASDPILLQRPIVIAEGRAVIGRPPENVLGIL